MKALTLIVLLGLSGCAHTPLDSSEIESKAIDARVRVNELAESLTETKTPILMFCGLVGEDDEKCEALRTGYELGREAIIAAQRYIDAFAQTGQGLAIVEAGVSVIEAAVDEVRAETERLLEEVQDVAGIGDARNEGGGTASATDSESSGQPSEVAEGEGSAEAADAGGDRGSAPQEAAREVAAPSGGEQAP